MNSICIISTQVKPNEGSENLWMAAAKQAAREGKAVQAVVRSNWTGSPEVQSLSNEGIRVTYWKPLSELPVLRILQRVSKNFELWEEILNRTLISYWDKLINDKPDMVLINQGGVYDVCFLKGLLPWIMHREIPYSLNARSGRSISGQVTEEMKKEARDLFSRATKVVTAAKCNIDEIEEELKISLGNALAIHSPIKNWKADPLELPGGDIIRFACVSRLSIHEKGLDLLLNAAEHMRSAGHAFSISLFGSGPDGKQVQEQIEQSGLRQNVLLKGRYTSLDEVWKHHHAHILLSRSEGMPQALMEAMMAGRVSIVTAVGGMAEVVQDERNGFVAVAAEQDSVNAAFDRFWKKVGDLKPMSYSAHQSALSSFLEFPQERLLISL